MTGLLMASRLALAVACAAALVLLTLWAGPDAEAFLAPVLRAQRVDEIVRTEGGRTACWTHHYDKIRSAEVVDAGWTIRGGGNVFPFQRAWRVEHDGSTAEGTLTRPVKAHQSSRRCAELPVHLAAVPLRITGFIEWRTGISGEFWTVRQATPEVEVP